MLLLLQIILCCLLYLALVKCAVRDSGRNCLYFYPDAYLDEAQKRGIADKTEELRKGKRFMTFFCLVIFAVLVEGVSSSPPLLFAEIGNHFRIIRAKKRHVS